MKVIFSDKAERDLEAIADWIAQDNPERARTFATELVKASKSIGRAPNSYPFVDKSRDLHLRRRVHESYLIFFVSGPMRWKSCISSTAHGDYAQIAFAKDEAD